MREERRAVVEVGRVLRDLAGEGVVLDDHRDLARDERVAGAGAERGGERGHLPVAVGVLPVDHPLQRLDGRGGVELQTAVLRQEVLAVEHGVEREVGVAQRGPEAQLLNAAAVHHGERIGVLDQLVPRLRRVLGIQAGRAEQLFVVVEDADVGLHGHSPDLALPGDRRARGRPEGLEALIAEQVIQGQDDPGLGAAGHVTQVIHRDVRSVAAGGRGGEARPVVEEVRTQVGDVYVRVGGVEVLHHLVDELGGRPGVEDVPEGDLGLCRGAGGERGDEQRGEKGPRLPDDVSHASLLISLAELSAR